MEAPKLPVGGGSAAEEKEVGRALTDALQSTVVIQGFLHHFVDGSVDMDSIDASSCCEALQDFINMMLESASEEDEHRNIWDSPLAMKVKNFMEAKFDDKDEKGSVVVKTAMWLTFALERTIKRIEGKTLIQRDVSKINQRIEELENELLREKQKTKEIKADVKEAYTVVGRLEKEKTEVQAQMNQGWRLAKDLQMEKAILRDDLQAKSLEIEDLKKEKDTLVLAQSTVVSDLQKANEEKKQLKVEMGYSQQTEQQLMVDCDRLRYEREFYKKEMNQKAEECRILKEKMEEKNQEQKEIEQAMLEVRESLKIGQKAKEKAVLEASGKVSSQKPSTPQIDGTGSLAGKMTSMQLLLPFLIDQELARKTREINEVTYEMILALFARNGLHLAPSA